MTSYRPYRFQFTRWHLLAAVLLLLLSLLLQCCRDQYPLDPDPHDASRIQGNWRALPPAHPLWNYDFQYPHLRQWIEDFGGTITEQQYIYGTVDDTLFASGPGGTRTWLLYFPDDSTCEYRVAGQVLQIKYTLRRLQ